jgi:hypothetical protein
MKKLVRLLQKKWIERKKKKYAAIVKPIENYGKG